MLTKKDKGVLNTFIKKEKLELNFMLSFFDILGTSKMKFIKKKDIVLTKNFFIFNDLSSIRAVRLFDFKHNEDLFSFKDQAFLIKENKTLFFSVKLFNKNFYKYLSFLVFKKNLINYNYYINLILKKN